MLAHAVAVIQQGGLFAWFKSDWRSAKALLMAQSRKPDTKFAELKRCSADLLKYSEYNGLNKVTLVINLVMHSEGWTPTVNNSCYCVIGTRRSELVTG